MLMHCRNIIQSCLRHNPLHNNHIGSKDHASITDRRESPALWPNYRHVYRSQAILDRGWDLYRCFNTVGSTVWTALEELACWYCVIWSIGAHPSMCYSSVERPGKVGYGSSRSIKSQCGLYVNKSC